MDKNNITYDSLLDKLRKTEPVLYDAEALTGNIMQRVERSVPFRKKTRIMRISAILSGAAASLLIGLLIYETMKYPVMETGKHSGYAVQLPVSKYPLAGKKISDLKPREKEKIIGKYIKCREAQQAQKERLYTSIVIKHKLTNDF